jgi:hypothetical protein
MDIGHDPAAWQTLFRLVAGASAALTDLLFVALSINLNAWVLVMRAAEEAD